MLLASFDVNLKVIEPYEKIMKMQKCKVVRSERKPLLLPQILQQGQMLL